MADVVADTILGRIASARAQLERRSWKLLVEPRQREVKLENPQSSYLVQISIKELLMGRVVVTPQLVSVAEKIFDHLGFYAARRYPSGAEFSRRLHMGKEDFLSMQKEVDPICITGLSGVGKSTILQTVESVLESPGLEIEIAAGTFPLKGIDRLALGSSSSARKVVERSGLFDRTWVTRHGLDFEAYMRVAYSSGLLGFGLDELQFVSTSSSASTKITNILLEFRNYGIPWLYVCNYSLLKKLVKRNHEERARVLTNINRVHPITEEQAKSYLCALLSGLERYFDLDDDEFFLTAFRCSAGLARNIVSLLSAASGLAAESKKDFKVTASNLETVYKSQDYAPQRADVEALAKASLWRANNGRADLICPPELGGSAYDRDIDDRAMTDELFVQSLTETEKRKLTNRQSSGKPSVVRLPNISRKEQLARNVAYRRRSVEGNRGTNKS